MIDYHPVDAYRAILFHEWLCAFYKDTEKALSDLPDCLRPLELDSCVEPLLHDLALQLDQIFLPIFSFEIYNYKTNTRHSSSSYKEFFIDNDVQSNPYDFINIQYRSLIKRSQAMVTSLQNNISIAIKRLQQDYEIINECFQFNQASLKSMSFAGSDRHNHSQQVIFFNFANKRTVVYKASSVSTDNALQHFITLLDSLNSDDHAQNLVQSLPMTGYGWQNFVEYEKLASTSEAQIYWHNAGFLLSVLDICGFSDGHFENLIARKNAPCIIDTETLFQNYETKFSNPDFEHSILFTSLIQRSIDASLGFGFTAGYQVFGNHVSEGVYPYPINERTLNLRVSTKGIRRSQLFNHPMIADTYCCLTNYLNEFIDGVAYGYHLILKNRDQILRSDFWEEFEDLRVRQLIRRTLCYLFLERISEQPQYATSKAKLASFLRETLAPKHSTSGLNFSAFTEYEVDAILRMDVPIFYTEVSSRSLFDGDGREYKNFFQNTPFNIMQKRISDLNEAYIQRQIELIKLHAPVEE